MIQLSSLAKIPLQQLVRSIKWAWNGLTGVVARPIYEQSDHLHKARREEIRWEPLIQGLTYRLFLESVLTNDPHPVSRIYVMNQSNQRFDRIEISVVARVGKLDYPEVIVVPLLDPGKIASLRLPNIPLLNLSMEGQIIRESCHFCSVFVTEIVKSGEAERRIHEVQRWSPTYDDFLNGSWSRRWGYLYNTNAIAFYKSDMRDFLKYYVYNEFWAFHSDLSPMFRTIVLRHRYLLWPNKCLCTLMCQDWMLSTICWTVLLLRARNLNDIAQRRGLSTGSGHQEK